MRALIYAPDNIFGTEHSMMPADHATTQIYKEAEMRNGELYMSHKSLSALQWMVAAPWLVIAAG